MRSDICGSSLTSPGASNHSATFTDDWYQYTSVYLLRKKSDLLDALQSFRSTVERQLDSTIKLIRPDNRGEYRVKARMLQLRVCEALSPDHLFRGEPLRLEKSRVFGCGFYSMISTRVILSCTSTSMWIATIQCGSHSGQIHVHLY